MLPRFPVCVALFFSILVSKEMISGQKGGSKYNNAGGSIIRIASYNVENLWDHVKDNTAFDEAGDKKKSERRKNKREMPLTGLPSLIKPTLHALQSSPLGEETGSEVHYMDKNSTLLYQQYNPYFSNWYDPWVLDAKVKSILKVLQIARYPEIVGFQEFESADNQSKVFDIPTLDGKTFGKKLEELGYIYQIIGKQEPDNPTSVTTAFISKLKLVELPSVSLSADEHNSSLRSIQVVSLTLPRGTVMLFNNHWKSKREKSDKTRIATAKTLRARINKERKANPALGIIVLGDLNAAPHEAPLKALEITGDESVLLAKGKVDTLYDLWAEVEPSKWWDNSFSGENSILSHILISDGLFANSALRYIPDSFEIIGQNPEEGLLNASGEPFRWQIQNFGSFYRHIGKGYSDHLPIVASFHVAGSDDVVKQNKNAIPNPKAVTFTKVKGIEKLTKVVKCSWQESVDIFSIARIDHFDQLRGRCVRFAASAEHKALPVSGRGRYRSAYVEIPSPGSRFPNAWIGLSMTKPWDWRPNIDDTRVSPFEALNPGKEYDSDNWHPRSNKCYQRAVMQGGFKPSSNPTTLKRVHGRLEYADGFFSINVASREDIEFASLPEAKASACLWD